MKTQRHLTSARAEPTAIRTHPDRIVINGLSPAPDADRPAPPLTAALPLPQLLVTSPELRGRNEMVLVVDDDIMIRRILQKALRDAGYRVKLAWDGKEAIEYLRQHGAQVALVVTDLQMPVVAGEEVVDWVLEHRPGLPILTISGLGPPRRDLHHLPKPFTYEALLIAVHEAARHPHPTTR